MFYLENFQLPKEDRRVYPYGLLGMKGLEHIEFAPITILYGNNINGRIKNVIKMRLWTIQGIKLYEILQRDGVAYCTKPSWGDDESFMRGYHWMAEQMKIRIGEPPIKEIEYPMWAWYQYNSAKSNKPPRSPLDIPEGISAYMEIEIPEKDVLLSCFSNWHAVLNQCPLSDWKRIDKETNLLDKEAGRRLQFDEYPIDIQREIEKSWEAIFDLNRRDKDVGRTHKRNRSIQATFWMLKLEHIISVEFLERKDNVIKRIYNFL